MNSERLFEFKDADSARARQRELSLRVVDSTPSGFSPRRVCGLDAAYRGDFGVGVAAVWDLGASCMAETRSVVLRVPVGYAPGLLGFREGPLVVAAAKVLRGRADVFLTDGHGLAHPDRFGLACHIGLALDKPTVGVAKSILHGRVHDGEVTDRDGTVLGRVFLAGRSRRFYVSLGHRVSLEDAFETVRRLLVDDHIAPLRAAHLESVRLRSNLPG